MHDALQDGRTFQLFNVIEDFNRERLTINVDLSLRAEYVVRILDRVIEWRGKPACLLYTSPSPRDATLSRMPSSA